MSPPPNFQQQLDQKRRAVDQARKQLEKARKNLERVEAELCGWEEAAVAMSLPSAAVAGANSPPDRNARGLSDKWKSVIAGIATAYPRDFTLAEIGDLAEHFGINAAPDTLRGQMHHYTNDRNYLERTSPGRFRATADGAAAAGVPLGGNVVAEDDADAIPF